AVAQEPGLVYYSMPLMKGGSTKDVLKAQGPYPPIEATRIARLAARALMVAHAQGLSHGNLKPSNIFVGESNEVKIADFTVPHVPLTSEAPNAQSADTALRAQDIATDLRLLGATYHWLLTGKPPTDREQEGEPALPGVCTRVVNAALSRRRGAGYQNAAEMVKALAQAEEALRAVETSNVAGL